MELINGVSFEDWAAASANAAAGMSEEEICKVLGVEQALWAETNEKWGAAMADLAAKDMSIMTTFSEIFTNPKVGKFANVEGAADNDIEALLKIFPDFDAYQKMESQLNIASDVGLDSNAIVESYGINLAQMTQISQHYSQWNHDYMSHTDPEVHNKRFKEVSDIIDKWNNHWTEFYNDKKVDLSDDIDF